MTVTSSSFAFVVLQKTILIVVLSCREAESTKADTKGLCCRYLTVTRETPGLQYLSLLAWLPKPRRHPMMTSLLTKFLLFFLLFLRFLEVFAPAELRHMTSGIATPPAPKHTHEKTSRCCERNENQARRSKTASRRFSRCRSRHHHNISLCCSSSFFFFLHKNENYQDVRCCSRFHRYPHRHQGRQALASHDTRLYCELLSR